MTLSAAEARADETQASSDVLVYTDTDNVVVVSPQVAARHELDEDGGEVAARVVLDAISAASADVVSSATYRFSELRTEVNLNLSKAFGPWLPSLAYRYSHEPDYQSHGLTLGGARKLAGNDATVSASSSTVIDSIGRVDTPSSVFSERLISEALEIGLTQNIDRQSLVRAVYSLTMQFGFMEKPYRSVPLFDAQGIAAADAMGGLDDENYALFALGARPLEEVPDSRFRHSVAVRGLRYIPAISSAARLDYRFYFDSWGISAHTAEPGLNIGLAETWKLNLWGRFHWQSSASFWRRAYVVDQPDQIPGLRSSDRSLSSSWHVTAGARGERNGERLSAYLEASVLYSRFPEFLFLDSRTALIGQAGVRWKF